jgi:hypothetical protein
MKIQLVAPNSPKVPIAIPQKRTSPARSAQMWKLFETFGPVILLLVVASVITAIKASFILPANLLTVGLQGSVNAVLSIGMTLVIISGGIDLSVGTLSLAMVVMAIFTNNLGAPMYVGILVCILVAVLGGLVNGFADRLREHPCFYCDTRNVRHCSGPGSETERGIFHVRFSGLVRIYRKRRNRSRSGTDLDRRGNVARSVLYL